MRRSIPVIFFLCFLFTTSSVLADNGGSVSREEFNRLKSDYDELKKEFAEFKQMTVHPPQQEAPKAAALSGAVSVEEFEALKEQVEDVRPGITNFVLSGYGFGNFTDTQHSNSNFTTGFSPIFLWEINDQLLFEAEPEFELEDGATSVSLEYADVSYLLNDYVTLRMGKFLSPFGIFMDRLHPKWINKLPNNPLGYTEGSERLVPEAQIGAEVRGGVPLIGESKANYAIYISNGPTLQTDSTNAGMLSFTNTSDNNDNKALGGRIGFLPIPQLEAGYSLETSRVGSTGTNDDVNALLQGADLSYMRDSDLLKGTIDLRAEQIWSRVDRVDYETAGGAFQNERWAHYFQAAYRPSKLNIPVVKNLEGVFRFDQINQPSGAPNHTDEKRYTWGLNYWLHPGTVVKLAYMKDNKDETGVDQDSFMGEVASAF